MKPIMLSFALMLAVSAVAVAQNQEQKQAKPTTEIVWEATIRGVGG